jgi:ABC-type phosphate/phosphonate transport system substrate-binding protein
MKSILKATLTIVVALSVINAGGAFAQQKKYRLILPGTYQISGKSKSHIQTMTDEISKALSSVIGAEIEPVYTPLYEEEYLKAAISQLVNKQVDFVGMSGDWYVRMSPQMKEKYPPLFGLLLDKKKDTEYCLYVRKSDGITKAEQLRGKRTTTLVYKDIRYLLYEAGIDEPLKKFFKDVYFQAYLPTDMMNALVDKRVDTFANQKFQVDLARGADDRYKDIHPIVCRDMIMNPFVIYRGDIDPTVISKIQSAARNWEKDKRFQNLKFFFMAVKGGIFDVKPKDFELTEKIDKLMLDRGWEEERKNFLRANQK